MSISPQKQTKVDKCVFDQLFLQMKYQFIIVKVNTIFILSSMKLQKTRTIFVLALEEIYWHDFDSFERKEISVICSTHSTYFKISKKQSTTCHTHLLLSNQILVYLVQPFCSQGPPKICEFTCEGRCKPIKVVNSDPPHVSDKKSTN